MKVLAIIPARGGSKGFPDKNIAKIDGITLLEIAIKTALDCPVIDDVYVSTDSTKYEEIARGAGAKSLELRPEKLASDTAKTPDVIIDLIGKLDDEYDYIVLLQPTSPLRKGSDIENMINSIEHSDAEAAVSVTLLDEPHPYKLKSITDDGYINPFIEDASSEVPRQLLPKAYVLNGALYVIKYNAFLKGKTFLPKKTLPYLMKECINIDTEQDFILLEALHNKQKIKIFNI
jgi:CMP-N-acetylneuraminic acid synthetase